MTIKPNAIIALVAVLRLLSVEEDWMLVTVAASIMLYRAEASSNALDVIWADDGGPPRQPLPAADTYGASAGARAIAYGWLVERIDGGIRWSRGEIPDEIITEGWPDERAPVALARARELFAMTREVTP